MKESEKLDQTLELLLDTITLMNRVNDKHERKIQELEEQIKKISSQLQEAKLDATSSKLDSVAKET